jgi:hypothetical protein
VADDLQRDLLVDQVVGAPVVRDAQGEADEHHGREPQQPAAAGKLEPARRTGTGDHL